jgi:ADP-heptose:LPS heptosyltransferase
LIRKVLVFHIGLLGDTIVSIPSLRAIRRHFGEETEITLLHNSHGSKLVNPREVLEGLSLVDKFIEYGFSIDKIKRLKIMSQLLFKLRGGRFETVVSLLPCFRFADAIERDKKFFRWCGIKKQLGFRSYDYKTEIYPQAANGLPDYVPQEARRRLARMEEIGIKTFPETDLSPPFIKLSDKILEKTENWLAPQRRFPRRALVAICPSTNMPAKEWTTERFAEIGRRLLALDKYELIIIGGNDTIETGEKLIGIWGEGINAAGKLSVLESGAVLQKCNFMIGLDTGTMHLASALNVPTVSLHSSHNNPGEWFPLGKGHVVLRHSVPCAGCRLEICDVPNHPCMKEIGVEDVWAAIQQFMLNGASRTEDWREILV